MSNINKADAVGIAEGWIEVDTEEEVIQAWQELVNSGLAWQLLGWLERTAKHLINEGVITDE